MSDRTGKLPEEFGIKWQCQFGFRNGQKKCGVYYLWDGAQVIFIGASVDVERTVKRHLWDDEMDFAGYFMDPCPQIDFKERVLKAIAEFNPIYNYRKVIKFPTDGRQGEIHI